jgi:hypothetical protein
MSDAGLRPCERSAEAEVARLLDLLRMEHESTVGTSLSTHRAIGDTPGCEVCVALATPPMPLPGGRVE